MMNVKRFIILLILFFSANAQAQLLANDSLSRIVNVRALSLISNYEKAIRFTNQKDTAQFYKLFHTKNASLFNDVMPDNNLSEKVSINKYLKLMRRYYADTSFKSIQVSPYEIGPVIVERSNIAYLSILATKKVNSVTRSGLVYIDTFKVRFDIVVDLDSNVYEIQTIESIERRGDYLQVYPQIRGFLHKENMPNDTIYANDKIYPVNKFGYTLIKDVFNDQEFLFVPYHNEVLFKNYRVRNNIPFNRGTVDLKRDRNIAKIKFWKWMCFADFQYSFIPNGSAPVKIIGDTLGINPINKGSFSNYLTLNLIRRVSKRGYFSLKIGGGVDVFNYQLNLASQINSYPAIDPDGDPYLRINRVFNIKETHNLVYLTAPIIIQKGFTFGKNSIYAQASYALMMKYSSGYNLDAQATYAGFYEYLFNLTISENGVYDFGTYDFKLRNLLLAPKHNISTYSLGIGYNRQFSRKVNLDIGLNYRSSSDILFKEDIKTLSDSKNGINSLINLNNKFKIEYVNMSIGLSVKI